MIENTCTDTGYYQSNTVTQASIAEKKTQLRVFYGGEMIPGVAFVPTGKHGGEFPLAVFDPAGDRVNEDLTTEIPRSLSTGQTIFCKSLPDLQAAAAHEERIDLTSLVIPERYRFIDCAQFIHNETLQIWETTELPHRYAAVSHVWRSLPPEDVPKLTARGVFLVECEDRNDGGPISIDVLRYTCLASLHAGITLLWLDRLCILQTSTVEGKKDKRWQIMHMYDIYKACSICLVLPAGLRRFPMKSEETEWIERAWTFQEVMVAPTVKVLYTEYSGSPPEIAVYNMHVEEYFKVQQQLYGDHRDGSQERRQQFVQALAKRHQYREPVSDHLERFRDVWEFVQWRISARPVDVVFSVMGLLGVTLDPGQFSKEDRLRATIAMAQAMLLKDDGQNTCIDIPMWSRLSRSYADTAREMGITTNEYISGIPTRVRLQDVEQELDPQPLGRRFAFTSKRSFISEIEGDQEGEIIQEEDLEGLKDVKATVMGRGRPDDAVRLFLARKVDASSKSRRKAERVRSLIPQDLLHRIRGAPTTDDGRYLFKPRHYPVIELCHDLSPARSVKSDSGPCTSPSSNQHVFGWSIQSTLWIRLGKYSRSRRNEGDFGDTDEVRSAPVPIITFFKFSIS